MKPINDNIILKEIAHDTNHEGFHVTQNDTSMLRLCTVEFTQDVNSELMGKKVLIGRYAGENYEFEGTVYLITPLSTIVAVI